MALSYAPQQQQVTAQAPAQAHAQQTAGAAQANSTAVVGTLSGRPPLRNGAVGERVRTLQALLNLNGATLQPDGNFGAKTESAVRDYQRMKGLTVDGIVGEGTAASLNGTSRGQAPAGQGSAPAAQGDQTSESGRYPSLTGRPLLERGSRGDDVKVLQQALIDHGYVLTKDGVFGGGTDAALRHFQGANGLGVDGRAGPASAAKLNSGSAVRHDGTELAPTSGTSGANGGTDAQVGNADPRGILRDSRLAPAVARAAAATVGRLQADGLSPYVFEGYRSMERQNDLFAQGGVTNARGGESYHNYGLAVDIVFYNSRGNGPSWDAPASSWQKLGQHGKASGFTTWGGDWGWDQPHLQYAPDVSSASSLLRTFNASGLAGVWDRVGAR